MDRDIFYWKVTDLWKRFCEKHADLLDKTYEEYSCLISREIEKLEECIKEKNEIIKEVNLLEKVRQQLIEEFNQEFQENKIANVRSLINAMNEFPIEKEQKHLFRFNTLLIDLIEKIQLQNKKNQVFVNKALQSLKTIREEALGIKNYGSYNDKGLAVEVRAD